jgi:hypothetical protein
LFDHKFEAAGGWKSTSAAEGYVGTSKKVGCDIANLLFENVNDIDTGSAKSENQSAPGQITFSNCGAVNFG